MAFDFRAELGAFAVKFLKIGRLTFGSGSDSIADAFKGKTLGEGEFWKAYESNVWAYRGINAIATAAGQLPIKVVEQTAAGNSEEVKNHPFTALVNSPNAFMTRQDLIELLFIFAESTGDAYWLFDDLGGYGRSHGSPLKLSQVKEIWPLPSHQMSPRPDQNEFIGGYDFRPDRSGKTDILSVAEVFHVRYPSPASLLVGQGSIRPIMGDIAADAYAMNFEKFIMKNLAANIIFLKTASGFTADQREEYRRSLANVFRGVKIAFMESGLDFATPQLAAKDLPFLELDARRQKRILGALGVPPLLAGSEDAKYDNAEQQKAVFWENTMLPKISRVGAMLTKKLHALGENPRLSVILDTSAVKALQADYSKQADTAVKWHGMGVPVNNLIKVFGPHGLEEIDGGDIGLVNAGLIPIMDAADPVVVEPEGINPTDPTEGKVYAKGVSKDKALDTANWKRFIAKSEPGFRRLRVEVKRFFKAQKSAVLARLAEHSKGFESRTKDASVELITININDEAKTLAKKVKPIMRAIYEKLGKQAVADIGAIASFNVGSPAAAEFAADHISKFALDVNKTTHARINKIITDALAEKFNTGTTQAELTKTIRAGIEAEYGFYDKFRAARIARTESGIAGNSGFFEGMKQSGVEKKRWIASRDEKTRDSHAAADGEEVGIDEPFQVGESLLDHPGDANGPVEEIVNCFPGDTIVSGRFVAGMRMLYRGPMRKFRTASGQTLSVTPNHPIATARGWVRAGDLSQGDSVLVYPGGREIMHTALDGTPNNIKNAPTKIDEIFMAFGRMGAKKISRAANQFYGDAKFGDGDIEIVTANRELLNPVDGNGGFRFISSSAPEIFHHGSGSSDFSLKRIGGTSAPSPRSAALALNGGPVALDDRPLQEFSFGPASYLDADICKLSSDGAAANSAVIAQLLHRFPGRVAVDEIVDVSDYEFSGHVYDLQSVSGVIVANNSGIITSNCRCAVSAARS